MWNVLPLLSDIILYIKLRIPGERHENTIVTGVFPEALRLSILNAFTVCFAIQKNNEAPPAGF